jgi:uncharacterized membrane protein
MKLFFSIALLSLALTAQAQANHGGKHAKGQNTRKIASNGNSDFSAEKTLDCTGTEPFWGLKLQQKGENKYEGTFTNPNEGEKGSRSPVKLTSESFNGMAAAYGGYLSDDKGAWAIIVQDPKCSDGMSDNEYAYEIFYKRGGVFYGCCNVTHSPTEKN